MTDTLPTGPQGTQSADAGGKKKGTHPLVIVLAVLGAVAGVLGVVVLGIIGLVAFTCSR